jgi:hypothetical protein
MLKLMINGHKVNRQFKREWTRHQLTNKWTVEDWLYRLQLIQYKLTEKKRIEYCGENATEVTFHEFRYHGFLIAELATWGDKNVMLTKLNRIRGTFRGFDPTKNDKVCTGITSQQIFDMYYWFGMELVLGHKENHCYPEHWKKGNLGWLLRRTNEAVDRFIKTVHQSMMIAQFHDFDVHKHAYSGELYWSGWKILRDALKRPVWANHLIRRLSDTNLKDNFFKHYHAWHDRYKFDASMKFDGDKDFDAIVKMDEAAVPFIYDIIKKEPDPIVRVLDTIYKSTVKYDGYVPLKDVCSAWMHLLPMCSNVIKKEKPA